MNPSAEELARQGSWAISGASIVTAETLTACAADAGAIAHWLGLRPGAAIPDPETPNRRSATAPARDAAALACPAA